MKKSGKGSLNREEMVFAIMSDGDWHTLSELSQRTKYPEASVSCSLRTLRRAEHGGFRVVKELDDACGASGRTYLYRLIA